MTHILLIDDDKRLADLLSQFFQRYALKMDSAERPSKGLQKLAFKHYDLVILDVMLPEMDGFEVCKQIRKNSEIPIIMLTARGEVMDRIVGLELGADDCLPKPFEPRELVARIQSILKRKQHITNNANLKFGKLMIEPQLRQAKVANNALPLSSMEYQLLEFFAKNPDKVLSRDEILNHLKGVDTEIFSRSVDILVSRLRHKLAPLTPIKTVRSSGYVFLGASV